MMLLDLIINWLFPPSCLSCGAALLNEEGLCADCWPKITFSTRPWCERCGKSADHRVIPHLCSTCPHYRHAYDKLRSGVLFSGLVRDLIHQFKYQDNSSLAKFISKLVTHSCNDLQDADWLIPMPMHPQQLRKRKYNQAALLCRYMSKHMHKPTLLDCLHRVRASKHQVGLNRALRMQNVKGLFAINPRYESGMLKDSTILLIDDVISTGASAHECALTLKKAGASKVYVLCISRN